MIIIKLIIIHIFYIFEKKRMDLGKKFNRVKKGDHPALGNFINYHLVTHKCKKKDLASGLDVSYNTFSRYLSQTSIQFTIVWRISQILNYNFLMDLGEWLAIPFETKKEKELLQELQEKDAEINTLKTQLGVYKQIHKIES